MRDNRKDANPSDTAPKPARRAFLKLGVGTAGIAAAGGAAVVAQEIVLQEDERGKRRYSLTPHVERFYSLNRL